MVHAAETAQQAAEIARADAEERAEQARHTLAEHQAKPAERGRELDEGAPP
ncbi:hypothetical protein ABZ907_45490 [Nonomuraea wenchangensis]